MNTQLISIRSECRFARLTPALLVLCLGYGCLTPNLARAAGTVTVQDVAFWSDMGMAPAAIQAKLAAVSPPPRFSDADMAWLKKSGVAPAVVQVVQPYTPNPPAATGAATTTSSAVSASAASASTASATTATGTHPTGGNTPGPSSPNPKSGNTTGAGRSGSTATTASASGATASRNMPPATTTGGPTNTGDLQTTDDSGIFTAGGQEKPGTANGATIGGGDIAAMLAQLLKNGTDGQTITLRNVPPGLKPPSTATTPTSSGQNAGSMNSRIGVTPLAGPINFTGDWSANAAGTRFKLHLSQDGNRVTGNYDYQDGVIEGTVIDNVLLFKWSQRANGKKGTGRFTLAANGLSFSGSRGLADEPDAPDVSWTGQRELAVAPFTGVWSTAWGDINLTQEGNRVTGTYGQQGKLEGTVNGDVLRFKFSQNGGQGAGVFTLAPDGKSFSGQRVFTENPNNEPDGAWSGRRK
jgi:hypothetical protein